MLRTTLCTSCFRWWQPSVFFHPANNSFPHFKWLNSSLSQSVTSCTPMKRKVSLNLTQQCCFTILTFFSPDLSPETSTYSMLSHSVVTSACQAMPPLSLRHHKHLHSYIAKLHVTGTLCPRCQVYERRRATSDHLMGLLKPILAEEWIWRKDAQAQFSESRDTPDNSLLIYTTAVWLLPRLTPSARARPT